MNALGVGRVAGLSDVVLRSCVAPASRGGGGAGGWAAAVGAGPPLCDRRRDATVEEVSAARTTATSIAARAAPAAPAGAGRLPPPTRGVPRRRSGIRIHVADGGRGAPLHSDSGCFRPSRRSRCVGRIVARVMTRCSEDSAPDRLPAPMAVDSHHAGGGFTPRRCSTSLSRRRAGSGQSCGAAPSAPRSAAPSTDLARSRPISPDLARSRSSQVGGHIEAANGDCGWGFRGDWRDPCGGACIGQFAYSDESCDERCVVAEGIYWAVTSALGGAFRASTQPQATQPRAPRSHEIGRTVGRERAGRQRATNRGRHNAESPAAKASATPPRKSWGQTRTGDNTRPDRRTGQDWTEKDRTRQDAGYRTGEPARERCQTVTRRAPLN